MEKFNYDSYMRDNPLMKEAEDNQQASVELEFSNAERKPDFQKDLKVYGIKVEPSGDKKKKYSGDKNDLHGFVVKYWGMGTANSIDETSGYGNYTQPETMLEDDSLNLGPDQKMMEGSTEVFQAYNATLQGMRDAINQFGLSNEDVPKLRSKLADYFK